MAPHLVRWHEQYAKKGLVVIDVDSGKRDTLEKLTEHVQQGKLPYIVIHDVDARNCETYGVRGYPSAFLVGVDGKVIWEGFPLPEVEQLTTIIEGELAKVKLPEESGTPEDPPKEPPAEDPPT